MQEYTQLPPMFVSEYGDMVTETITLIDAGGSMFNVWMQKNADVYMFTAGISDLRIQYNLLHGGWLDVYYLGQSEFHVKIMDREYREVNYFSPPIFREIGWVDANYIPVQYDSDADELNEEFYKEFYFTLKKSHVVSNKKVHFIKHHSN